MHYKKNAYLYCKFRDEQFALYDEYAKRNGMMMKTLLVVNVLYYDAFYNKGGMTQKEISTAIDVKTGGTLTKLLENLTGMAGNKRNKIVQMPDAGRNYCEKVVRHITWAKDMAMSMFTPDEQKHLIDLSRTFTKNLTILVNQETVDM